MAELLPHVVSIPYNSAKHQKVLDFVMRRVDAGRQRGANRESYWKQAENTFSAYIPEKEVDARRRNQRDNQGIPHYTTVTIPYSYATLLTAHAYWTSVFLARDPVFQMQGMSGEAQTSELAVESLLHHFLTAGNNLVPYFVWLLDQGKYGEGILGMSWDVEKHYIPEVRKAPKTFAGMEIPFTEKKYWSSREVLGYEGIRNFNVRPQDFLFDPSVTLQSFQSGEFAGHESFVPRLRLLDGEALGKYYNLEYVEGRKYSTRTKANGTRTQLPRDASALLDADATDGGVDLIELTVELVPKHLGLANREFLEKWSFTIANECTIISAQPQGWYHNKFMYDTLEYEIEGYNVSKRGMLEMLQPLSATLDWLINSHFFNVRKNLNGEFIYDPSVLLSKDVEAPGPGKLIRFRPTAYGKDVRAAFYQLQTMDVTQGHLKDAMLIIEMMQRLTGVNDAVMGMVQSGRRSATEIRTSTSMAVNRLKTQCEYYSAMGFTPHASRMLMSSQQMFAGRRVKLYRSIGNRAATLEKYINVGPDEIAGQYSYTPVDGTLPIDRSAQAAVFGQIFQQAAQIPQVASRYDMGLLFGYLAELQGMRNLEQFRIQTVPDAVAGAQAAAGNLVPMSGANLTMNGAGVDPGANQ